jgi:hypothetical protein
MLTSRRAVWVAGFILIALGVVGLVWSHALVPGWWQGTLQALGVGFLVGGVIDVLAISGLNRIIGAEDQRRQTLNQRAIAILQSHSPSLADYHDLLASRAGLDPDLETRLYKMFTPQPPP